MSEERKQRVFSGIQPSGALGLGGYIGAVKNWLKMQEEYDCCFCVASVFGKRLRRASLFGNLLGAREDPAGI